MWAALIHYFCERALICLVLEEQLNRLSIIIRSISINYSLCLYFFQQENAVFVIINIFLILISFRSLNTQ